MTPAAPCTVPPRYPPDRLTAWTAGLLTAAGAPETVAGTVARHLVGADLSGHRGHGLAMLPAYLDAIAAGELRPAALPAVVADRGAHLTVDGGHGFGHHTLAWTLARVIERAGAHGLAGAHLVRCGHVGRLGGYALDGARASAAVLVTVGSIADDADALVAPHGGTERLLGTNPVAFGCPGDPPLVVDLATSAMAYYDLVRIAAAGGRAPAGVLADDALDLDHGGAMRTFGGHRGYGVSLLAGVLSALAAAAGDTPLNGAFVLAIDQRDAPARRRIDAALDRIRAGAPADPARPVLVPGDRGRAHERAGRDGGVDLPQDLVERIAGRMAGLGRVMPALPGAAVPADGAAR